MLSDEDFAYACCLFELRSIGTQSVLYLILAFFIGWFVQRFLVFDIKLKIAEPFVDGHAYHLPSVVEGRFGVVVVTLLFLSAIWLAPNLKSKQDPTPPKKDDTVDIKVNQLSIENVSPLEVKSSFSGKFDARPFGTANEKDTQNDCSRFLNEGVRKYMYPPTGAICFSLHYDNKNFRTVVGHRTETNGQIERFKQDIENINLPHSIQDALTKHVKLSPLSTFAARTVGDLRRLLETDKVHEEFDVQVIGYTGTDGGEKENCKLSSERSWFVDRALRKSKLSQRLNRRPPLAFGEPLIDKANNKDAGFPNTDRTEIHFFHKHADSEETRRAPVNCIPLAAYLVETITLPNYRPLYGNTNQRLSD